jgi:hypothetical protein
MVALSTAAPYLNSITSESSPVSTFFWISTMRMKLSQTNCGLGTTLSQAVVGG